MKKYWRQWRIRRQARAEAFSLMAAPEYAPRISPAQKKELLTLRNRFPQEKMGTWLERLNLYLLAAQLPPGATIVEIGAWVGVGTCYLGCGLRSGGKGKIVAVDTFAGTTLNPGTQAAWNRTVARLGGTTLEQFHRNLAAFGLEDNVIPVVSDSTAAAAQWPADPIDLLYVDGDHVYEVVKADYENWRGFIKPGGWIVFHDYDARHPGVQQLVEEALAGDLAGKDSHLVDALLMVRI